MGTIDRNQDVKEDKEETNDFAIIRDASYYGGDNHE